MTITTEIELLSLREVAERKKCRPKTVWDAIRRKVLPAYKVGYSWVVLASDLHLYRPQKRKPYKARKPKQEGAVTVLE
jgi:hypothetical protein